MGGKAVINGREYDFTGLGDADNAAVISEQMAQVLLDIQKNYGAEYVKQRLANLRQADPTGYAARQQLFDRILADVEKNPDRPLADDLQAQIVDSLHQGAKLDSRETEQVQQDVRGKQLHSGIYLGNAAASEEANAVVGAGEQMRDEREQQALAFQTAGVSPEDVEYRRIQQGLSNLGSFVNGQTPTAQFGSLSGAGNGAAPFTTTGGVNQSTNPNAGLAGIVDANNKYAFQASQISPWAAAASGGINALQAYQSYTGGNNPFLNNGGIYTNPNVNAAPSAPNNPPQNYAGYA